ncbi:MAG: hypothetical protein RSC68_23540 [Acinetobacter sp.]
MTRRVQTPGATQALEKEDIQAAQPVPEVEQQLAAALERIAALEQPKQVESVVSIGAVNQQTKPRVAVLTEEGWVTKETD